ncbi:hypothetical protein AAC387_Pa07g2211 [Persea americana]
MTSSNDGERTRWARWNSSFPWIERRWALLAASVVSNWTRPKPRDFQFLRDCCQGYVGRASFTAHDTVKGETPNGF